MLPFYLFISCLSWPSIGKNFASGIYNPHYLPYSFYCRRLISLLIRISQKIFPAIYGFGKFTCHGRFIESRNTSKSLYNIWQRSSPLLNERIAKIWKQFSSHDGFLRTTQDSKKMLSDWLDWLHYLAVRSKSYREKFNVLHIFAIPSSIRWKTLSNIGKTFFGIPPLHKHIVMFVATLFGLLVPILNLSCLKQFTDKRNRLVLGSIFQSILKNTLPVKRNDKLHYENEFANIFSFEKGPQLDRLK